MKHSLIVFACLALLLGLFALPAAAQDNGDADPAKPEVDERLVSLPKNVVAKIGDKTITVEQLKDVMFSAVTRRREALSPMISRTLLDMEAKAQGVSVTDKEMTEAFEEVVLRSGGRPNYDKLVGQYRIDPKILKINARYQILLRKLLEEARKSADLTVTEKELRDLYEQTRTSRYDLQAIVVADGNKLAEAIAGVKKGQSFGYLAAMHSRHASRQNGGMILNVLAKDLPAELRGPVLKLKPGEYTDPPVRFGTNHWIVKLLNVRGPEPNRTFETERQALENSLRAQKEQAFTRQYMQDLTKKYNVRISKELFSAPDGDWSTH